MTHFSLSYAFYKNLPHSFYLFNPGPYDSCPAPCFLYHNPEAILKRSCESSRYPVKAPWSNICPPSYSCLEIWSKLGWRRSVTLLSYRLPPKDDLGSQTMVSYVFMCSAVVHSTRSAQMPGCNCSKPLQTALKACHGQPASDPNLMLLSTSGTSPAYPGGFWEISAATTTAGAMAPPTSTLTKYETRFLSLKIQQLPYFAAYMSLWSVSQIS